MRTATDLEVIEGRIPDDIDGIYLRNTENQLHHHLAATTLLMVTA